MFTSGAYSGAIRFVCHIPLGVYAFHGFSNYQLIRDLSPELLHPPLSNTILFAQGLGGVGGILAFAYNFLAWIPTILVEGRGLMWFGIADCVVCIVIGVALSIQAAYYPLRTTTCRQLSRWSDPFTESDPKLLLFDRMRQMEGHGTSALAPEHCTSFLTVWYVGLVVFLLYTVSATVNLGLGTDWFKFHRLLHAENGLLPPLARKPSLNIFNRLRRFRKQPQDDEDQQYAESKPSSSSTGGWFRRKYSRVPIESSELDFLEDLSDASTIAEDETGGSESGPLILNKATEYGKSDQGL